VFRLAAGITTQPLTLAACAHALRRSRRVWPGDGLIGVRDVPGNSPARIKPLSRLLLGAPRLQHRNAPLRNEQPESPTDEGVGSYQNDVTLAPFGEGARSQII